MFVPNTSFKSDSAGNMPTSLTNALTSQTDPILLFNQSRPKPPRQEKDAEGKPEIPRNQHGPLVPGRKTEMTKRSLLIILTILVVLTVTNSGAQAQVPNPSSSYEALLSDSLVKHQG